MVMEMNERNENPSRNLYLYVIILEISNISDRKYDSIARIEMLKKKGKLNHELRLTKFIGISSKILCFSVLVDFATTSA